MKRVHGTGIRDGRMLSFIVCLLVRLSCLRYLHLSNSLKVWFTLRDLKLYGRKFKLNCTERFIDTANKTHSIFAIKTNYLIPDRETFCVCFFFKERHPRCVC